MTARLADYNTYRCELPTHAASFLLPTVLLCLLRLIFDLLLVTLDAILRAELHELALGPHLGHKCVTGSCYVLSTVATRFHFLLVVGLAV